MMIENEKPSADQMDALILQLKRIADSLEKITNGQVINVDTGLQDTHLDIKVVE